jgi:uncharacterized membrane protein YfcA
MPVYLIVERQGLQAMTGLIALATIGVVIGTLAGRRILADVPEPLFRRVVAVLLVTLGLWMVLHG